MQKILIICNHDKRAKILTSKILTLGFEEPTLVSNATCANQYLFSNLHYCKAIILDFEIPVISGEVNERETANLLFTKLKYQFFDIPILVISREALSVSYPRKIIWIKNLEDTSELETLSCFLLNLKKFSK